MWLTFRCENFTHVFQRKCCNIKPNRLVSAFSLINFPFYVCVCRTFDNTRHTHTHTHVLIHERWKYILINFFRVNLYLYTLPVSPILLGSQPELIPSLPVLSSWEDKSSSLDRALLYRKEHFPRMQLASCPTSRFPILLLGEQRQLV